MYNVYDYINFYKDKEVYEYSFNIIDDLIISILSYLPINFNKKCLLKDIKLKSKGYGHMYEKALDIYSMIKDSKRYKNLKLIDYTSKKDDCTQFGALTFELNNLRIISFEGTDGSFIGWFENFRLGYSYPTYTQNLAYNYLDRIIKGNSRKKYHVVGHSKGGNLAVSSAMNVNDKKLKKISKIYNFDGPGFREKEYKSLKYKKVSKKVINIVPYNSYIGVLLNSNSYNVIKTSSISFDTHDPTYWNIFGEYFIPANLSIVSDKIHNSTTSPLEQLDNEKMKDLLEELFKTIDKSYTSKFSLNFFDIQNIYKSYRNIDPEITSYMDDIIKTLLGFNK